jgi:hypothetical protein
MGEVVTITVPALFVKRLPQDLPGDKSLTSNHENILAILDDDPEICRQHPLGKKKNDRKDLIECNGESTDLFYLQTED